MHGPYFHRVRVLGGFPLDVRFYYEWSHGRPSVDIDEMLTPRGQSADFIVRKLSEYDLAEVATECAESLYQ